MNEYSNIKARIKSNLETVTEIKVVYGYEKGDLAQFPSATIRRVDFVSDYETDNRDVRVYTFHVRVYQEINDQNIGASEAESRIDAIIDKVLAKFESDYTLGGNTIKAMIRGLSNWEDREMHMRILEFQIEAHALVTI